MDKYATYDAQLIEIIYHFKLKPPLFGVEKLLLFFTPTQNNYRKKTTTTTTKNIGNTDRSRNREDPILRRIIHISLDFPSDHCSGGKGEKAPFFYQNTL